MSEKTDNPIALLKQDLKEVIGAEFQALRQDLKAAPAVDLAPLETRLAALEKGLDAIAAVMLKPVPAAKVDLMNDPALAEQRVELRAGLLHELQERLSPLLVQAIQFELAQSEAKV